MTIFYKSKLWIAIWIYILSIYLSLPVMRSVLIYLKDNLGADNLAQLLNASLIFAAAGLVFMAVGRGWRILVPVVFPLCVVGFLISQLHIPEERMHFLQYGILGLMVIGTAREGAWPMWLQISGFVILIGVGDELIQWWLPNRVGDLRDVAMNSAAGLLGLWVGKCLYWGSPTPSFSPPP